MEKATTKYQQIMFRQVKKLFTLSTVLTVDRLISSVESNYVVERLKTDDFHIRFIVPPSTYE